MSDLSFILKDAKGTEHKYVCVLHGADIGMRISMQMLAMGLEPLAKAASDLLTAEGGLAMLIRALKDKGDTTEATALLLKLDMQGVAAALSPALGKPEAAVLVKDILAETLRDGVALKGAGLAQAYQGNYGEMYRAVWEVVRRNGFLPLPSMPPS